MMRACDSPLLTDLYQLTMMQAYLEHGLTDTAVFEFFVRKMPESRNFLVCAGLEQALRYLECLRFSEAELAWLQGLGRFSEDFIDYLRLLRFHGDVHAMREGELCFADEPMLRITAPMPVAQLVESRLINILHFQTLIASKAARIKLAAPDHLLVDFGLRRTHEAEAALMAARATYLAGLSGSSTVLAGAEMDVPVFGTMAHAFVQAHDNEEMAFLHFARTHRRHVVLLIDTYDTERGAHRVVKIAPTLRAEGIRIDAVRLDSGDLAEHARKVRRILDAGGLTETRIFVSGNLDEYALAGLKEAPIDGFGIGTRMDTSADAPYLDCAYKLQEYSGIARRKTSEGKATWPGRKQVYRYVEHGTMSHDILTLDSDRRDGRALIEPVMKHGVRLNPVPSLESIRQYAAEQMAALPAALCDPCAHVERRDEYRVEVAAPLQALASAVDRRR